MGNRKQYVLFFFLLILTVLAIFATCYIATYASLDTINWQGTLIIVALIASLMYLLTSCIMPIILILEKECAIEHKLKAEIQNLQNEVVQLNNKVVNMQTHSSDHLSKEKRIELLFQLLKNEDNETLRIEILKLINEK